MNITNISKNKRRLKRIVYGSFLLGSFFEITTAAHASSPGTSSFDLNLYYELVQRVESGDIEGISRVLAAIGDEKAQIDALLAPFFDPWTQPW
jgi:hypothetical protein